MMIRCLLMLCLTIFAFSEGVDINFECPKHTYKDGLFYAKITVSNTTGNILKNIKITNTLPDGINYMHSRFPGKYVKNKKGKIEIVYLNIETLNNKTSKSIIFEYKGVKEGVFTAFIKVESGKTKQEIKQKIQIEKITKLKMFCKRQKPFIVGEKNQYEIIIQNGGNGDLTNIIIDCVVPKNIKINIVPKEAIVNENNLVFSIDKIATKTKKIIILEVFPFAKGEAKLRLRFRCQQFSASKFLQKGILFDNRGSVRD